jgi:hypothetical protein
MRIDPRSAYKCRCVSLNCLAVDLPVRTRLDVALLTTPPGAQPSPILADSGYVTTMGDDECLMCLIGGCHRWRFRGVTDSAQRIEVAGSAAVLADHSMELNTRGVGHRCVRCDGMDRLVGTYPMGGS